MINLYDFNEFENNTTIDSRSKPGITIIEVKLKNVNLKKEINSDLINGETILFHKVEFYNSYVMKESGISNLNTAHWDLFIDERKEGKKIINLGFLFLQRNISSQFYENLLQLKDNVEQNFNKNGKLHNNKIGEIHWKSMNQSKFKVAEHWIQSFFKSPMTFFLAYTQKNETKNRIEIIEKVIKLMESNTSIPNGLSRLRTTVHIDYEKSDIKNLWKLERIFRILRVFPWDSKGSPLLQLSDVLINIAANSNSLTSYKISSNKGSLKNHLLILAKKEYDKVSSQKNNFIKMDETGKISKIFP